ncbi:saccharopine dehydrogenase-like oxidoreductase [Drosophila subobscura]|uniref:saccharopine dehydrogenase-like oxidoreductase n=1 Tax=Drosophila subobscura TaxID=7241 RepID=UPI00155AAECA|nr:saccharopine dehydrogenase-like oxidoreductase [Drosophila subobscura]
MEAKKLDAIIFGATGFTGKYTVLEAVSVLKGLSWGIAGRNQEKLQSVLKEMSAKTKTDLSQTPIIIADVNNEASLLEMAQRCRIVVNTAGPYRFFGENVVKACIESGTHHVDVSGEPQYMESIQLKYNDLARERGVYVISACGFDSIPADLGVVFVEKNFDGVVNSVENFVHFGVKGGTKGTGSASVNTGTWESAIHAIANRSESIAIRRKLFPDRLPKFHPELKPRAALSIANEVGKVILPFPEPDLPVVMRSQRYLYENEKKRPVQMQAYMLYPSRWVAGVVVFLAAVIGILAKFSLGRQLLLKYPSFFSGGMASRDGPSEARMERTFFRMTMKATGWPKSQKLVESSTPLSKTLTVQITGPNPAYGSACVALLSTAKTILNESDKMPSTGGVLPPGAAFSKTSLISELEKHEHGIKYEIVANK